MTTQNKNGFSIENMVNGIIKKMDEEKEMSKEQIIKRLSELSFEQIRITNEKVELTNLLNKFIGK